METEREGNDDEGEGNEEEETKEDEMTVYWQNLINGSGTTERDAPNLGSFLVTKHNRDASTNEISVVMGTAGQIMDGAIETLFQDFASPYFEDRQNCTTNFEYTIKMLMKQNHTKRKSMEDLVIQTDAGYQNLFRQLLHAIRKTAPPRVAVDESKVGT